MAVSETYPDLAERPMTGSRLEVHAYLVITGPRAHQASRKARAQAYRNFCDAVTRKTFHWFLVDSRVWQVTPSAGDGDAA
jgi:hypothetical protein